MLKKFSAFAIAFIMLFCFSACGNSDFEDKGDYLTGNKWEGTDGTLLDLKTDGSFKYYESSANKSDNYYTGNFEVLNGQDAINYLNDEYGFSEDAQRSVMVQYGVKDEYYYVLILNNDECIINGTNTLEEKNMVEYFGYYSESDMHLNFTSLKNMGQVDFYKK